VGETCTGLDALLLRATGCTRWAYITAFNPGSRRLKDDENHARQRELESGLRQLGYPMFPGEGIGDDGTWPPEPSILTLCIEREAAVGLGRRFRQLAIVCGELDGLAELVLCE
jgi:hypothetical protein